VIIFAIINGGQQIQQSSPMAQWWNPSLLPFVRSATIVFRSRSNSEHKLWWKVPYERHATGTLSATVLVDCQANESALMTSSTVHVHFLADDGLFSSINCQLTCQDYRVSLLKKKILSGRFAMVVTRLVYVSNWCRSLLSCRCLLFFFQYDATCSNNQWHVHIPRVSISFVFSSR
jgi:hypothetical protein